MGDNIHATLVLLGDRGVLITGVSGSGKSSLALDLLAHAHGFAALVSDDRVLIEHRPDGRVIGRAPASIRGQIEIHGFGIVPHAFVASAVIDLLIELVDPAAIIRMPDRQERDGVPLLQVPWRTAAIARQHVAAALRRLNSGL